MNSVEMYHYCFLFDETRLSSAPPIGPDKAIHILLPSILIGKSCKGSAGVQELPVVAKGRHCAIGRTRGPAEQTRFGASNPHETRARGLPRSIGGMAFATAGWRPHGDSNPSYRRESHE